MFELEQTPVSTTSQRVERKYPLPDAMLDLAVARLSDILPVHRYAGEGDWSSIRTVYLDTPDFLAYQDYLVRMPIRKKIRIRQYGENGAFGDLCWVEVKVKNHRVSMKRRFCCPRPELVLLMQGEDVLDRIAGHNEGDISHTYQVIRSMILEQKLRPAVRIDYERLAFQSPDSQGFRITLDRNLRFVSGCGGYRGVLEGLVIETKHHGEEPEHLREMRKSLGVKRAKRFSKFARSVKQIFDLQAQEAVS
jgi:SPX domain protein involved in polyphosphate accumulation